MARVHDTVVEGTTKLLMWKESAAIVAVRHLCTGVNNIVKLHYRVEMHVTRNKMGKFGKCSIVQTINWCFSFNLAAKLHCGLPRILLFHIYNTYVVAVTRIALFFADFQLNSITV